MPSDPPARVLIVDPAYLGDAVFSAALARAVKAKWPGAEVGLVLRPPADRLAPFMPHVDVVHRFDKRGADRGLSGARRLAARLEKAAYDLALVPHPSLRSTWLAARAGVPERVGSAPGWLARRPLTTHRTASPGAGLVQSRLQVLEEGHEDVSLAGCLRAEPLALDGDRARVGLVVGSEWATKRWPVEHAARLVASLDPERTEVHLLGAPNERPLYDRLKSLIGGGPRLVDAVGEPIEDLVRRIASCHAVVAGDTGPLQIARGLGVATVALFGPTDPTLHRFAERDRVLTVADLPCRPCSRHGHHRCPEDHHRCLVDLSADRVAVALGDVLEATA